MSAPIDHVLGVDLGGTRLKVLALTRDGRVLDRVTIGTGGDAWSTGVRSVIAEVRARLGPPLAYGAAYRALSLHHLLP